MFLTLSRLGSLLVEVAEPLFGSPPAKATVDKSVKEAEGQIDPKAAVQSESDAAPMIAIAAVVSTGHVVRMEATPPVHWDAVASAWTCAADTAVEVMLSDGSRQIYDYPEGTAIRVAAGMIHFPKCDD